VRVDSFHLWAKKYKGVEMKNGMKNSVLSMALVAMMFFGVSAFAAKEYQVTGPIVEVSDSKIVIQKGSAKWTLARDASTKVDGDLEVGSKATVYYSMTATDIEVKKAAKKKKK
jgi:hypothetical protein